LRQKPRDWIERAFGTQSHGSVKIDEYVCHQTLYPETFKMIQFLLVFDGESSDYFTCTDVGVQLLFVDAQYALLFAEHAQYALIFL